MRSAKLLSGNQAAVYAAVLSGCRHFYGYPITPVNTLLETAADLFSKYQLHFLQAESEIIAINMVMGASAAGQRVLTATSGPGLSLMQEGLSYMKASDLPAVIINVMRGGPGLGNIYPSQADYNLMTKANGHGDGKCIVLAPNSPQEMFDLTREAFLLADKYRHPVIVGVDGAIAQSIEEVCINQSLILEPLPKKPWAIRGDGSKNNITSVRDPPVLEEILIKHRQMYDEISIKEQRFETFSVDNAKYVFVAYGIISRIVMNYILHNPSQKYGLIRPITLWPFPEDIISELANEESLRAFVSVEVSLDQMHNDLARIVQGHKPMHTINRLGGNLPSIAYIDEQMHMLLSSHGE